MQALACPACGDPVEDAGLCVKCWDGIPERGVSGYSLPAGRRTNRKVWAAWDAGLNRRQIARKVGCSLRTVHRHLQVGRMSR